MKKSRKPVSLLIPCATVFISSACIMIIEIVAGRLIARFLGSTLYVWTSVIGVVLGGITIGNYAGGRLADKYPARQTLAVLFAISSVTCVLIVLLNHLVGNWIFLWQFPWPVRVFLHVALVFLVPSALLGTISPVVAKNALEQGLPQGRTIGRIYAWGAAGSIVGTFAAGFFLISLLGTSVIIWLIGAILLLMAIIYWFKFWPVYVWSGLFLILLFMGVSPLVWAARAGAILGLRDAPNPDLLYEDESNYCYIAVEQVTKEPDTRQFVQDDIRSHSKIIMGNVEDLQFVYTKLFAAVTHLAAGSRTQLSTLFIGGGGFVVPRYIRSHYPGSNVVVAELDPGVTHAAREAFGLTEDAGITIRQMDARNYVENVIEDKKLGKTVPQYDCIYGDAFGTSIVPFQLTTHEFNTEIETILAPDGVYLVNLVDLYTSGEFLGSFIKTLRKTFPYVYVVSEYRSYFIGRNFVVVGSRKPLEMKQIITDEQLAGSVDVWILDDYEINSLAARRGAVQLTDDYAPVEQLLSPFVVMRGRFAYAQKFLDRGEEDFKEGLVQDSVAEYRKALAALPELSVPVFRKISEVYASAGRWNDVLDAGNKALEYNNRARYKVDVAEIHYFVGIIYRNSGAEAESRTHLEKAVTGFKHSLTVKPDSPDLNDQCGNALAYLGRFDEALPYLQKAVSLSPGDAAAYENYISALMFTKHYDEAKQQLSEAIHILEEQGKTEGALKLKDFADNFEARKAEFAAAPGGKA